MVNSEKWYGLYLQNNHKNQQNLWSILKKLIGGIFKFIVTDFIYGFTILYAFSC